MRQRTVYAGFAYTVIQPSKLPIEVKTQRDPKKIDQVRIVPHHGYDVVEVIHTKEPVRANVDPFFCVGIDLGVTKLAAIASNRKRWVPRLVNGRPLKACNQWYNKRMKELKLKLLKEDCQRVTRQMEHVTNKRKPDAFLEAEGSAGFVVHPARLVV